MNSFKLTKSKSNKDAAKSAGALLLALGIVFFFVVQPLTGICLGALGVVLLIGGLAADE